MIYSKSILLALSCVFLFSLGCSVDSKKGKGVTQGDQSDFEKASGTNFRVNMIKATSIQITQYNNYGWPNKKHYNLYACILGAAGEAALPDIKFTVSDSNGDSIQAKPTDINGCLTWSEEHEFNYIQPETYFKFKRIITPVTVYKGAVYVDVVFYPWATESSAAFLDLRYNQLPANFTPQDIGTVSIKGAKVFAKEKAELKIRLDSISFESEGKSYKDFEINPFLGLKVAHSYEVNFSPQALRKTLSKLEEEIDFSRGTMKVNIALIKEESGELISSVQFDGKINLKQIKESIIFKFDNVSNLNARSRLVVTLQLDDGFGNLTESSYEGLMLPGHLTRLTLAPSERNAVQLIKAHTEAVKKIVVKTPFQFFMAESKLVPIDVNFTVAAYGGNAGFNSMDAFILVQGKKKISSAMTSFISEICKKILVKDDRDLKYHTVNDNCKNINLGYRNEMLDYKIINIVETIHSKNPVKVGTNLTSNMKFEISYEKSKSDEFSYGYDAKLSAEVPGISKIGLGIGGFISKSAMYSSGSHQSYSASTEMSLKADINQFEIDVTSRSCLIFTPTVLAKKYLPSASGGMVYCPEKLKREKRVETYYLLSRDLEKDSLVSDNESEIETGRWNILMRGNDNFEMFKNYVDGMNVKFFSFDKLPLTDKNSPEWKEFQISQEFPGVLSR